MVSYINIGEETMSEKKYGDDRRTWQPKFVKYMEMITKHPNYKGMPWAIDDEGVIRWNAPSNRPPGGKWSHLHEERLEWWRQKANTLGIPQKGKWISKVAKQIHPTGKKPCQTCGREFEIFYIYPTKRAIQKLNTKLDKNSQLEYTNFLTIYGVIDHLFLKMDDLAQVIEVLKKIFPDIPGDISNKKKLDDYFRKTIVPSEPRGTLSPGAMSDAPDRLDGFHSYNLCCRHKQDTGRTKENLQTYSDDRRAFEYWCEGNWAAANYLMTQSGKCICADPSCGKTTGITADHIGPISLGFTHIPHFIPLCRGCNSSKGNRLTYKDIIKLLQLEKSGEKVISWQAKYLWDNCKHHANSEQKALLLSKLLRINQHHYLSALSKILKEGLPDSLLQFLHPEYAVFKYEVINLHPDYTYDKLIQKPRYHTYEESKIARMIRIAYDALEDYSSKKKRNIQDINYSLLTTEIKNLEKSIQIAKDNPSYLRKPIFDALKIKNPETKADELMKIFKGNYKPNIDYSYIKDALEQYMNKVGKILQKRFNENRAIRLGD
jgi:Alw26I/Eco31I/Esp3I family type II restriction endonuclease